MKLTPVSAAVLLVLAASQVHAKSDVFSMEEVVVTANRIEQPMSELAGSVAVVTSEEIEQKGETELYDALRHEPGVSVSGGAGRPQNITIRGMTGNRIMIIRDGIRSADGFGANDSNDKVGRDTFDLSNLESLEVVKGASSSVLGSGAIGGAVILKSKQPGEFLKDRDFYVDATGTYTGISNKYKGASNLAFRSGDTESLVNAAYWQGEETRNFSQDLYNRDLDGYSASYAINHFFNDEVMVKARAELYRQDQQRLEGSPSIQKDGKWHIEDFAEDESTKEYSAYIGAEMTPINPKWFEELDTKVYWRHTEVVEDTNRLMRQVDHNGLTVRRRELEHKTFIDETIGFRGDFTNTIYAANAEHQLAYGIELSTDYYERTDSDSKIDWNGVTPSTKQPFAPARAYNIGLYVRDMVELDKWTITGGLRFDAHRLTPDGEGEVGGFPLKDMDSSEVSPSLSISREVFANNIAYASYNHGYRAPEYDKAYGFVNHDFVPLTPFVIAPNMDLEAETSDSFEIGNKFDNGRAQLYVSAFYNKFQNFIDVVTTGQDNFGNYIKQYQNLHGVETYGAELSAAYAFTSSWKLSTKLGYVDGKDAEGEYVRSITPFEGNVGLNYQQQDFNAFATWNWAGSMDRVPSCQTSLGQKTECAQTDSWNTLDLGASYQITKDFRLSATIINLFDKEYIRYQDVAGIADESKRYSTEPGRYFTVNAKYIF
ncbi:TonB-dependent hemoglobin/transferrin/lactoferrin family receptor [Vibrio diabolicus]|uniref:TonB-dependent hemoglobin/transferrin/lactoferrin family receptor n=1 Tax=Vibrio diabolicus TaxID=50719 RepID=UPI00062E4626|nr:TonB-dependent hemoglobin/transferrin/lactoferrin family receptor [Vibrio diabolicus]KLE23478.1 ligand-gated channel [Vibrio diabolicus]MCS0313214.1 TonB-dependent hemoglobin/transferrin/lactoferrin family receptor [Vibrio diabolicus]